MSGGVSLLALLFGVLTCTRPFDCNQEFDSHVGIVLWCFLMLYTFKVQGTLCDAYFVPAIEQIVERLSLAPDVAGATFLAAGSSAPELATSSITTFFIVSAGGLGTIVGSAIFNILVIVGLTGVIACKDLLRIWWYPLARDCTFYIVSIIELLIFVRDSKIEWWEAVLMVLTYVLYIVYMKMNPAVVKKLQLIKEDDVKEFSMEDEVANGFADFSVQTPDGGLRKGGQAEEGPPLPAVYGVQHASTSSTAVPPSQQSPQFDSTFSQTDRDLRSWPVAAELSLSPGSRCRRCRDPFDVLLEYTMPSPEGHYWILFFLSIFWICVASFVMVDATARMGQILAIDDLVMGLIFLAAGTSIPDALGSIAVAKRGEGDMAVANALGSNVFDILMGLGLPWAVYTIVEGRPFVFEEHTFEKLQWDVFILLYVLSIFLGSLMAAGWNLTKRIGVVLMALYGFYVLYTLFLRPCVFEALELSTRTKCIFG